VGDVRIFLHAADQHSDWPAFAKFGTVVIIVTGEKYRISRCM